jgi:translation elongation factor EF-Tu-like GTPase
MCSVAPRCAFVIAGRGLVATGRVESGTLRVGEEVQLDGGVSARVDAIEKFRKKLDEAVAGENVGLLLSSLGKGQIARGTVLTSGGASGGITVNL